MGQDQAIEDGAGRRLTTLSTAGENERRAVDRDHRDRARVCDLVGRKVARFRVRLPEVGLIDNQLHRILELTLPKPSRTGPGLSEKGGAGSELSGVWG
jgi:hypothetical protein